MTKKADKYVGTAEYEQGRAARRGAISIDEAPYGEDDDNLAAWKAGYEFETEALGLSAKDEPKKEVKQEHNLRATNDALKGGKNG